MYTLPMFIQYDNVCVAEHGQGVDAFHLNKGVCLEPLFVMRWKRS